MSGTGSTAGARRGRLAREDEPGQVGARLGRGGDVLLARQAADLDERAREQLRAASRPGSGARISVEPTSTASAPASSAAAPWARAAIALSATTTRSRGARSTSSSCARRSIAKVARSRALIPIGSAPSSTARCELVGVVRLDERVEPELARGRHQLVAPARRRGRAAAAARRRRRGRAAARARPRSEKNPFASSGTSLADRAAPRSASVPPKRSSTRIETARAPARSNAAASAAGSASGPQVAGRGRAPLDLGDRGEAVAGERVAEAAHQALTSAACENATSASSRSSAAPESTASRASSRPSRRSAAWPAGGDRAGGVEQDRRALAAVLAAEDRADRLGVVAGRAAAQLGRVAARDAELERVDLALAHAAVHDLADEVRPGGRELVDPGRAVDDERAPRAELREHLGDRAHERRRVDADHLRPRAGGVRQRPEHVEDGPRCELAPDRRRVPHRRMVRRREQEAEAELVDRALDLGAAAARAGSRAPRARPPSPRPTRPRGCRASRPPRPPRPRRAPPRSRC